MLAIIRINYFIVFLILGGYIPFISLLLRTRGFTYFQIGWICAVYGFASVACLIVARATEKGGCSMRLVRQSYVLCFLGLTGIILAQSFWGMLF